MVILWGVDTKDAMIQFEEAETFQKTKLNVSFVMQHSLFIFDLSFKDPTKKYTSIFLDILLNMCCKRRK